MSIMLLKEPGNYIFKHSHKELKNGLETGVELAVLVSRDYIKKQAILESILLYRAQNETKPISLAIKTVCKPTCLRSRVIIIRFFLFFFKVEIYQDQTVL